MTDALKKFFIFQMNLCLPEEGIVWDGQVHTATFKMDNRQGPTLYHRELSSMFCASLDGRGVWGRMDTCICMAESLLCLHETITTLITSYIPLYPNTRASQVVLMVKNPPASAGDIETWVRSPGLGRSLGGRHGNTLQYSWLENSIDREAWRVIVQRVTKSLTQLKGLSTHPNTK